MSIFYTAGDIPKKAWLSTTAVKQAAARGELTPGARTRGGITLFCQTEAERYIESRRAAVERSGQEQTLE